MPTPPILLSRKDNSLIEINLTLYRVSALVPWRTEGPLNHSDNALCAENAHTYGDFIF